MERGNSRLKFFDKYLGPLLLALLSPLRLVRSSRVPTQIRTVGLLKTAAIGDTVLLSAIVSDLREFDPKMRVVLFTGASNASFSRRIAGVEVIQLPLTKPWQAVALIRQTQFDVFIDFDPWPRISALFSALAKASLRLGFRTQGQRRHYAYSKTVEHRADQHELENYRSIVRSFGVAAQSLPQAFGHQWTGGANTVVFHLWPSGTSSHLKEWSPSNWIWLAEQLPSSNFVLTGGPEDVKRTEEFIERLPSALVPRFKSIAGTSFDSTLKTLQSAALLVSVNTGVMHIGAAMGVPTVGLHGPTNPLRWGPIGQRTVAIVSRTPGAATLNLGFEYNGSTNYMDGLDRDEVLRACRTLLGT